MCPSLEKKRTLHSNSFSALPTTTEEMCVWSDPSEVQVGGHQEAGGGGRAGRGRVQGGDGGGRGPQQGHLEEVCTAGADAGGPAQEKWEISPGNHW